LKQNPSEGGSHWKGGCFGRNGADGGESEKEGHDGDRCLLRRHSEVEQWGGVRCTVNGRRGLGRSGAWRSGGPMITARER
jgi:hypothetical protein